MVRKFRGGSRIIGVIALASNNCLTNYYFGTSLWNRQAPMGEGIELSTTGMKVGSDFSGAVVLMSGSLKRLESSYVWLWSMLRVHVTGD